ncbi:cation diffusion facilitator family transporter [Alkaliphilus peptidifermentans]|uniref:Cation diffusion facilitator family transporter n=1 Tax=Alkaliphilus peptidifermentans DSM 18978 TaxID=1120976 RepID=A0A1G5GYS3_9FIRM|nr:cation diffusion facilitator family transporter [Alkaliphilus peptidifermentans]SCY56547.1 cation diffusion facilitator family transporter [Alkaliphilus peptidifermentans DSM 18978]
MNRFKAAYLAISVSVFLVLLKVFVGFVTNSISIISDALHSSMDVIASTITLVAMNLAKKPEDKCHNYGHGKYEDLAAAIQSVLILIISVTIITQAALRIVNQNLITETLPGIFVMIVSITLHSITVLIMLKYAKKENSVALRANALHLLADVVTSVGIIVGLVIIHFTGLKIIDPIVAIVVALIIIKTGYDIGKESIAQLLDKSLSLEEMKIIKETLAKHSPPVLDYHHLRTRRVGQIRQVDVHLIFPNNFSLMDAHDVSSNIEKDIQQRISTVRTTIHLEPETHNHSYKW